MLDSFYQFGSSGFMPHGHCFLWTPPLLWAYVLSDLVIATSYFSIPFALWYFVQRRRDLPFPWVFSMFGAFVLACGATHLFAVWNIWHADYWADAGIKAFTAIISAASAILLWSLIPKALTIPSRWQLETANSALQDQVRLRERAENEMRLANEVLERRVRERTLDLEIANRSLRESDARFRSLTAMSSDFYWESDVEHRFTLGNTDANMNVASIWRTPIGKRRWELQFHSPDEAAMQAHRALLEAHLPFRDFRVSRLGADGTEHYLSVSGDPLFDAQGAFTGYCGVGTDITERMRTEQALERESHRNQVFLRNASDGVHILDADGNVLEVSDSFCEMLGYSREELLGANVSLWAAERSPQELRRRIADQMGKDGRRVFVTQHRRRDGSTRVVEVSVQSLELAGKRVVFNSARDITERVHAERELVESEERFRGLVEQSIAGIYIVQDSKYIYVNPRFAEILGYDSAEELIGRDRIEAIGEEDRAKVRENRRRIIEGEAPSADYAFTALKKDGTSVEIGAHSSRATHRGRPAVIGLMQDISDKKRAAEQISHYISQLEKTLMGTVNVATTLSEMRDPYTAGHERRVAKIAVAIGAELGFNTRQQEGLQVAGHLHDIGKITIPSEILSKPGRLSPIELRLIQEHAQASYDVLKGVEFPWPVAQVALQHHERIDGSGYPQGLKGDAILLEARIMAVADVVEAMSSHRPYRPGLGIEQALAEIERGRGRIYDPVVADACLRLFREKNYQLPT